MPRNQFWVLQLWKIGLGNHSTSSGICFKYLGLSLMVLPLQSHATVVIGRKGPDKAVITTIILPIRQLVSALPRLH